MHFTIERKRLLHMLRVVQTPLQAKKRTVVYVRLSACSARVFVECNGIASGEEALVLREGACTQSLRPLYTLLRNYPDKDHITIEADEQRLRIAGSTRPVINFSRHASPPAAFQVGRVTDTWLAKPKV